MQGDAAIRWQTLRDLLGAHKSKWQAERKKVATTGWGARFLSYQDADGKWGGGIYSPKWISTTYTLLQLRDLGLDNENAAARRGTRLVIDELLGKEKSNEFTEHLPELDLCIAGMVLALTAYFGVIDSRTDALVRHLLQQQMGDDGWNCRFTKQRGITHSSFHTTFNVLDGLRGYLEAGHKKYRAEILRAEQAALEAVLEHKLFRSDKTNKVIHVKFTQFSYPFRWHYDVMRGLDYLQRANAPRDGRAQEAIDLVRARQGSGGLWAMQDLYKAQVFFNMETPGQPSRWNTLRARRVLKWWDGA